jgi:hypothetical protein
MTQPLPGAAETLIAHEVVAHVLVDDEPPVPLPAELRYDRSDPFAVRLSIGTCSPRPVDWVFARSLLEEGTTRPAGIGDVLVTPRPRGHRPSVPLVRLVVRSPAGQAVLDLAASAVTAFLERTHVLVPPGAEGPHVDLDRAVAELLAAGE